MRTRRELAVPAALLIAVAACSDGIASYWLDEAKPPCAGACGACQCGGDCRSCCGGSLCVFPGAAGFGTDTPAGSGRHLAPPQTQILRVTTLSDSGVGSLRAAVETPAPRTIVFEVSGRIALSGPLTVADPYCTIAGQTAPAPGILLSNYGVVVNTHDVLLQHLAVRPGLDDPAAGAFVDGLTVSGVDAYKVVIDHLSLGWSPDEPLSVGYGAHDVAVSHSILSESLQLAGREVEQGYCLLFAEGGDRVSAVGNLLAHCSGGMPYIPTTGAHFLANNVSYDGGVNFSVLGGNDVAKPLLLTAVANVFLPGPVTQSGVAAFTEQRALPAGSAVYVADTTPPPGGLYVGAARVDAEPPGTRPAGLVARPAVDTLAWVMGHAGSRPRERDGVDARVVSEVTAGSGRLVTDPAEVGGYPAVASNVRSFDAGSAPMADPDGNGYTALEELLQQAAAALEGGP